MRTILEGGTATDDWTVDTLFCNEEGNGDLLTIARIMTKFYAGLWTTVVVAVTGMVPVPTVLLLVSVVDVMLVVVLIGMIHHALLMYGDDGNVGID